MVACATASLICACRDRRSVFRRAGPRTDIGRWVAQGVRGDRPCRGVRPGAPPGLRGREGHRVSWSSRPTRTRRARGRPRSPPLRGSSRTGSAWYRWRAAAAAPSTSGPASPQRTGPARVAPERGTGTGAAAARAAAVDVGAPARSEDFGKRALGPEANLRVPFRPHLVSPVLVRVPQPVGGDHHRLFRLPPRRASRRQIILLPAGVDAGRRPSGQLLVGDVKMLSGAAQSP